jgi:hypothetical protein
MAENLTEKIEKSKNALAVGLAESLSEPIILALYALRPTRAMAISWQEFLDRLKERDVKDTLTKMEYYSGRVIGYALYLTSILTIGEELIKN